MARYITAPLTEETARSLRAGESVYLSGTVYTARDAAHKRLCALVAEGKPLPFPIQGSVIYYVGPSPARPGQPIGSAGPTTSYRMDAYAPTLLRLGELGMIGKGKRSPEVIQAMKETGAVYFGAIGGAIPTREKEGYHVRNKKTLFRPADRTLPDLCSLPVDVPVPPGVL